MDILATFATDEALEIEGRWVDLSKTTKVRVARLENDNYLELLRERLRDAQLEGVPAKQADATALEIVIGVMAETVLLDWSGVTEGKGAAKKPVPYSAAKAAEYLRLKDFRKKIEALARDFDAFRLKAEADQGND